MENWSLTEFYSSPCPLHFLLAGGGFRLQQEVAGINERTFAVKLSAVSTD